MVDDVRNTKAGGTLVFGGANDLESLNPKIFAFTAALEADQPAFDTLAEFETYLRGLKLSLGFPVSRRVAWSQDNDTYNAKRRARYAATQAKARANAVEEAEEVEEAPEPEPEPEPAAVAEEQHGGADGYTEEELLEGVLHWGEAEAEAEDEMFDL
jgi:hypothetical protein